MISDFVGKAPALESIIINSPLILLSLNLNSTDLTGDPAKRCLKMDDQLTKNPQLEGCGLDILTLYFSSILIQEPSEPNLGHDKPPNESKRP